MLSWFDSALGLADEDEATDPELAAQTRSGAEDMLRAMLIFAGAGLDSAIKQLIRDALPSIMETNELAGAKLLAFTENALAPTANPASERSLARYLTSSNPRQAILDDYVQYLTGSSLQSVNQVELAAGALGLSDPQIRRRIKELRPLFIARNEIVHELDLLDPGRHGDRQRRARTVGEVVSHAHLALDVGQVLINAVVDLLGGEVPFSGNATD
jgi:hypothetical protein